jgi:hypothetical protein
MNIGGIIGWSIRLSFLGLCLYGLWRRNFRILRIAISGLGGNFLGWGTVEIIMGPNRIYGALGFIIGLGMITAVTGPSLLWLWRRKRQKGYWIQINNQKFRIPPGTKEVDVYIDILRTANPALKVEKTMAPKNGEKDEDYKERMR